MSQGQQSNPVLDTAINTTAAGSFSSQGQTYTYYHAGPLFSLSDLHTNVLLSQAIQQRSGGRYNPILPQDLEQRDTTPHSIRDQDLKALLHCDLALITYDGSELDSGTVIEYMVAKMADIPCVILRTDFRGGGDQGVYQADGTGDAVKGDPWNLMSSFWPRTRGVVVDGMVEYKTGLARALKEGVKEGSGVSGRASGLLLEMTAAKVVEAMDAVVKIPARMPKELRDSVYRWIGLMPGFKNVNGDEVEMLEMLDLLKKKEAKGLLRTTEAERIED